MDTGMTRDLFETRKLTNPLYEKGDTIQQRFEKFHKANGWVYDAFVKLARDYARMGRKHIGMKHLAEIIRWRYARDTTGDEFKINNTHISRYARLLAKEHPDLGGMFEFRSLRS